eukprot:GFKZ01000778.1.p5 GENE.GFKZ01000778.1~~GFKZ01000778.1.p5  ORF type:complete len:100 (+),score=9.87 GFKZ01000778.1:370-669(+)
MRLQATVDLEVAASKSNVWKWLFPNVAWRGALYASNRSTLNNQPRASAPCSGIAKTVLQSNKETMLTTNGVTVELADPASGSSSETQTALLCKACEWSR